MTEAAMILGAGHPTKFKTSTHRKTRCRPPLAVRCAIKLEVGDGISVLAPSRRQPRGIVHFIGGAFAGAAPITVS